MGIYMDMESERAQALDHMLKAWLDRYNMWIVLTNLDTSFVDVGLFHTLHSATRLSWHAGARLNWRSSHARLASPECCTHPLMMPGWVFTMSTSFEPSGTVLDQYVNALSPYSGTLKTVGLKHIVE